MFVKVISKSYFYILLYTYIFFFSAVKCAILILNKNSYKYSLNFQNFQKFAKVFSNMVNYKNLIRLSFNYKTLHEIYP